MHAEDRKHKTVFPRSHEDADMQDAGGTNSGKHYERTQMMVCQQMQEGQILHGIYKVQHTITAKVQEKTADQSLPRGRGRKRRCTAHHRRHGQPFKAQHDVPCVTEAH